MFLTFVRNLWKATAHILDAGVGEIWKARPWRLAPPRGKGEKFKIGLQQTS